MTSNAFLYKNLRSNAFLIKIFGLSGFFNPDLQQYRIKSALCTSRNPDFSALPRCCVLKCTDWSLGKSGVGGGVQAHPQKVLICQKFGQNL